MSFYVSTATFFLLHCDEWDRVVALPRHKFVTGATLLQLGIRVLHKGDHKIKISLRLLNTSSFRSRFITNSKSLELVIEILTIYETIATTQISILLLVHCIFFIYIYILLHLISSWIYMLIYLPLDVTQPTINQSINPYHHVILPLKLWVRFSSIWWRDQPDIQPYVMTVYQWVATVLWFSSDTPVPQPIKLI